MKLGNIKIDSLSIVIIYRILTFENKVGCVGVHCRFLYSTITFYLSMHCIWFIKWARNSETMANICMCEKNTLKLIECHLIAFRSVFSVFFSHVVFFVPTTTSDFYRIYTAVDGQTFQVHSNGICLMVYYINILGNFI